MPPASEELLGRYRHFKGNEYEVIGIALHCDTLDKMVVYRGTYEGGGMWVRPLESFISMAEKDGVPVPRFEKL